MWSLGLKGHCILKKCLWRNIRISCFAYLNKTTKCSNNAFDELMTSDEEYNDIEQRCFGLKEVHNCLIIQPYVKWGPKKLPISPEEQLEEAIALIKTLPSWDVENTITVPLESLEKNKLFGSGNMEKLKQMIRKNSSITAVFVNQSILKKVTKTILQENFHVQILDRYHIVIQILKMHAISKHAKLQVALAELYFFQRKAEQNDLIVTNNPEKLKLLLQRREVYLKKAILEVRNQRKLLRNNRKNLDYPVIAVLGYTNSGKTSLIKALTGEEKLQPKNKLFATLDVTVHEGMLPSGLKVLYVDTVGFISNIPTNLLECFVATLEDALLADIILHVEDLASTCFDYKRDHVLQTIQQLADESTNDSNIMNKVMSVANKCDLENITKIPDTLMVSAKHGTGLENLRQELETKILQLTSRQKMTVKVANGGEEMRWLYKNATVISEVPDEINPQYTLAKIIITKANLGKFKHVFTRQ